MSYLLALIKHLAFAFLYFAFIEYLVCRKEISYYTHRLAQKIKSRKKKKSGRAADETEAATAQKPDSLRFFGKTICCTPVLVFGYIFATFAAFSPEDGYSDSSVDTMLWLFVAGFIVSLLLVIIGILLCCYSRMREKDRDVAALYALLAHQQSENEDLEDQDVASVIDLFDSFHPDEDE